jgi:D-sedoheptulose 7-phosphate isomerase
MRHARVVCLPILPWRPFGIVVLAVLGLGGATSLAGVGEKSKMTAVITPTSAYRDAVAEWNELLPALDALAPVVEQLGQAMLSCWRNGGKVLFAGNGGSAADAMHFAEELVVRFNKDRPALAAIALLDPTAVTCVGNDLGYDHIFARQIDALGKPGDLFCGLTTSGNSVNIIRAMEMARRRGLKTCGFLGKDGGKLKGTLDVELIVPSKTTARVQEAHKLVFHSLCVWIDEIAGEFARD